MVCLSHSFHQVNDHHTLRFSFLYGISLISLAFNNMNWASINMTWTFSRNAYSHLYSFSILFMLMLWHLSHYVTLILVRISPHSWIVRSLQAWPLSNSSLAPQHLGYWFCSCVKYATLSGNWKKMIFKIPSNYSILWFQHKCSIS